MLSDHEAPEQVIPSNITTSTTSSPSTSAEVTTTAPTTTTHFELPKGITSRKGKLKTSFYKRYWQRSKEAFAETSGRIPRTLTAYEQVGNNVMITIKTTLAYHNTRVQLLLDTWISLVNASNIFLVTDGNDQEYENKAIDIGKFILSTGKTALLY